MSKAIVNDSLVLYSMSQEAFREFEKNNQSVKKKVTRKAIGITFTGTALAVLASNALPSNVVDQGVNTKKTVSENEIKVETHVKSETIAFSPEKFGAQYYTKDGKEVIGTVKESEAKVFDNTLNRPIAAEAIKDIKTIGVENNKFVPFVRYEVSKGDKAYAPGDGKVVKLTDNTITIKHTEDGLTYYSETAGVKANIKENQTIKKGQALGKVVSETVKFAVAEEYDGKQLYKFIHPNLAVDIQKSEHLNYETGKVEKVKPVSKESLDTVLPPTTNKATKEQREVVSKLPYGNLILKYADEYDMDPVLIAAVIKKESDFNPEEPSPAGALGLMQFMPGTAPEWGVTDRTDPEQSIKGGTRYLKSLIDSFDGSVPQALYAYNWGIGNLGNLMKETGVKPDEELGSLGNTDIWDKADLPYKKRPSIETKEYAPKIIGFYRDYLKQANEKGTNSSVTNEKAENKLSNSSNIADAVLTEAAKHKGKKYLWGAATTRTDAFDCSSFTLRSFKAAGITLPRTSLEQSKIGTEVSLDDLKKGDLVFFDTNNDGVINHVGIYTGNNTMINASKVGVSYAKLKGNPYWGPKLVKAVRVKAESASTTTNNSEGSGRNHIGNVMANLQKTGLNKMDFDVNSNDWLVTADSGVNLDKVNPELLKRISEVAKHYGKKITINSGYRTFEQQKVLYNAYKSGRSSVQAAKPGNSRHNYGLAIDVDDWVQQLSEADLKQFGLHKPVSSENWHVEPLETKGETPTNIKEDNKSKGTPKEEAKDDKSKGTPKEEAKDDKSKVTSKEEAKDDKSKDTPKEEAKDDKSKVTPKEEAKDDKSKDTPKEEAKDDKSKDTPKEEAKDDKSKDTPKEEAKDDKSKDTPKEEAKDDKSKDTPKEEAKGQSSSSNPGVAGTKEELDKKNIDNLDKEHNFIYHQFFK
ncbi:transglycosylase SLT domain-containing protein [Priestia megaterium]|uniref:Transglycosylase SLT domain-containing protein n=1 Tax=Priestia megaterium TaxID=1404 RepID=A0A6M6E6P1_PRIMG|nr:transglycosylase SLT domain-containing protein [Priestia megaterium]QJX80809.1 transglycosylase SLT domain-containing protein [Priestia megaterium]